jgi:hypothetical protein
MKSCKKSKAISSACFSRASSPHRLGFIRLQHLQLGRLEHFPLPPEKCGAGALARLVYEVWTPPIVPQFTPQIRANPNSAVCISAKKRRPKPPCPTTND